MLNWALFIVMSGPASCMVYPGSGDLLKMMLTFFAVLTNWTVGALNNLEWDWGNNDTLGFNTVYFRFNAADPDTVDYLQLLSYNRMPTADTGAAGGFKITAGNSSPLLCIDASVMLFVIASGATTPVVALEFA